MLKYKIHIQNKSNEMKEIKYDSLYFSSDMSFITGVTDITYGLSSMSYVFLEDDGVQRCPLIAKDALRCGFVIYNKKYKIEHFNNICGIKYIDGQYYCLDKESRDFLETRINPFVTIDNFEYELGEIKQESNNVTIEWKEYVEIPTKYWVYDNKVTIDNIVYDVIIDNYNTLNNDNNYYPFIVLNDLSLDDFDRILYVIDWEYSKRKLVTLFTIKSQDTTLLNLDEVYYSSNNSIDMYALNMPTIIRYNSFVKMKPLQPTSISLTTQLKTIENTSYIVVEYKNREFKTVVSDENAMYFVGDKNVITIKKDNETYYYIVYGNNVKKINYNETIETKYPIDIDGKIVFVPNEDKYSFEILNDNELTLKINDIIGQNAIRCKYDGGIDYNLTDYSYELINPLFNEAFIAPITVFDKAYITEDIKLYTTYLSNIIPLKLETSVECNLHHDYIIQNNYLPLKRDEKINRIVDMEKDVYFPARYETKNGRGILSLCHQIQIDLHFRSRNLETWVVNEDGSLDDYGNKYPSHWNLFDYYRYANGITPKVKEHYPILNLSGDKKYYPPSDLLYFLNFTNEDVYYQKQKIAKSFLRLSFFDSPIPNQQNLLYSTVIFMSESDLFNKFVDNEKKKGTYRTLAERGVVKKNGTNEVYLVDDNNIVEQISVATEPLENNVLTFDDDKRLSCSFTIRNMYESLESSEGFYLYFFKEMTNGYHERTVYLKVEFNHAGYGKTVNFMNLYYERPNGEPSMIDWSKYSNYDRHKNGYALNEIVGHLYIEVKLKYDANNKRFCYYLPEWMSEYNSDKRVMKLSLFEVKIKDESGVQNESNT